jgi:hypothetical protein
MEFAGMLESSGVSKQFDKRAALAAKDSEAIDFDKVKEVIRAQITDLADDKQFPEGDLLLEKLSRDFQGTELQQQAFNRILKQGGTANAIRKVIRSLDAEKLLESIKARCSSVSPNPSSYHASTHILSTSELNQSNQNTCEEECQNAIDLCVFMGGLVIIICQASVVFPELAEECQAAAAGAVFACAAAALICEICDALGEGGGGIIITP